MASSDGETNVKKIQFWKLIGIRYNETAPESDPLEQNFANGPGRVGLIQIKRIYC
jgi:hypothetical protein